MIVRIRKFGDYGKDSVNTYECRIFETHIFSFMITLGSSDKTLMLYWYWELYNNGVTTNKNVTTYNYNYHKTRRLYDDLFNPPKNTS